MVLLYCIIASFIVFYCITLRFILLAWTLATWLHLIHESDQTAEGHCRGNQFLAFIGL